MTNREMHIVRQRAKYIFADWLMTLMAFSIFNIIRYYIVPGLKDQYDLEQYIFMDKMIWEIILVPCALILVYAVSGFYNNPYLKSRLGVLSNTLINAIVGAALIYFLILLNDFGAKSRDYLMIIVLIALLFTFIYIGRSIVTQLLLIELRNRGYRFNVLIIGNSYKSREMAKYLSDPALKFPYKVVGFIRTANGKDIEDGSKVWDIDRAFEICRDENVNQIVIALNHSDDREVMMYVDKFIALGIPIKIAPDTLSYVTSNIRLADIMGTPLVDLTSPKMNDFQKNFKRILDIIVSSIVLIVLCPLLIIIALAVKKSSKGPVIYRQERVGVRQRPFWIYKFRSMYIDAENEGPQLSHEGDKRITGVGKILRKYRLDELPQFWNVLRGDMSLVGPRPERKFYVRQIISKAPYYTLVFQVRPGITSWGMVKYGYASNVDEMVDRSRYDLIYLNNMSLSTDVKIIIYTVRTVLKGEGK